MDLPLIFNCSSLWNEDGSSPDGRSARAISSRWLRYGVTGQPGKVPLPCSVIFPPVFTKKRFPRIAN